MNTKVRESVFLKRLPWLGQLVPPHSEFETDGIDDGLLNRAPGLASDFGMFTRRNRILLVDVDGWIVAEVLCKWGIRIRGTIVWFPISSLQEETVHDALVRLGDRADYVRYIVGLYPKDKVVTRVVIYAPRGDETVAAVWNRSVLGVVEKAMSDIAKVAKAA